MSDHYAEAERLLSSVGNVADADDRGQCLAEAQVHATLAFVQWQRRADVKHTNREAWRFESQEPEAHIVPPAEVPGYLSIPWPPSEELEGKVAEVLHREGRRDPAGCVAEDIFGCPYIGDHHQTARAVLDAIGGDR